MTIHRVLPGDDLQRAINDAKFGDEILLKPSGEYVAPADFTAYTMPNKGSGTLPITIRSEAPPPDKRVTPTDRVNMPKLVTRVGSPGFFDQLSRSHHYRFSNLWFTNQRRADGSGTSYLVGGGYGEDEADFAHDIEYDHCFFNPLEWDEEQGNNLYSSVNYAVETAGRDITVRDSYMTGFGCRYANDRVTLLDSGGVLIGTSPGPYTIDNCYIDAWFVGFFLGGGDPGTSNKATVIASSPTSMTLSQAGNLALGDYISFRVDPNHPMNPGGDTWGCAIVQSINGNTITFPETWVSGGSANQDNKIKGPPPMVGGEARWRGWIPSDIRVTRTDFYKPKRWYDLNGSDGKGFFEIKLGDRVLIDGCTFDGRTGCTITVRNQGGAAAWSVIRNLTMSNCLFKQFAVLFATLFDDNQRLSMPSTNIKFDNVLAYGDIGPDPNFNIRPKVFTGQHGDGIEFNHITALQSGEILRSGSGPQFALREQMTNFKWTNCITNWGTGEQHGFMCLNSTDGKFTPCAPNAVWTKSVMIGAPRGPFGDGRRSLADFPAGNFNPATVEDVGFVDPAKGEYGLRADSPYRGMGTDGKDIGVDMVQLRAHLSGEVVAPSPEPPTPTPTPIPPIPPTPPTTEFTWERVPGSPDAVQTIAFIGPTLYVGTKLNGIFAYDGSNWRQVNEGLPSNPVWVGNFYVTRQGSLLASMRFRETPEFSFTMRLSSGTWVESANGRNEYASFYVSDKDGNVLASTNTAAVLRSVDDGRTFQQFSQVPPVSGIGSSSFSLGSGVDGTIYLHSHDTGEFYSNDGGKTWIHMPSDRSGPFGNQTALLANAQGQMIAATGFGGIYRNRGSLTSPSIQLETNLQVSNDAGAHSLIRLADGVLVSHFIRIAVSRDGGAAWNLENGGIPMGTTSGAQNIPSLHTGDLAQGPDGRVYVGFVDAGFGVWRTTTGATMPTEPQPVPEPPTPPTTPPPATDLIVQGRTLQGETTIEGVKVRLAGMETVSRGGDGFFWFETAVPVGSVITGEKEGWVFTPVMVKEGVIEQFYGLQGVPVVTPPVPDPVPIPEPEPEPEPIPPAPAPCTITAPSSVSIRRNSSGTIAVTLTGLTGPVEVKVIGSDGQVTVSPLTWTASATSSVKQFQLKVKKQSRTISFVSSCGSAVVRVNVM
jgi:hypothetical protein